MSFNGKFEVPYLTFDEHGHITSFGRTVMTLPSAPSTLPSTCTVNERTGMVTGDNKVVNRHYGIEHSGSDQLYESGNLGVIATTSKIIDADNCTGIVMAQSSSGSNMLQVDPITRSVHCIDYDTGVDGRYLVPNDMGYRFTIQAIYNGVLDNTNTNNLSLYNYVIVHDKLQGKSFILPKSSNYMISCLMGNMKSVSVGVTTACDRQTYDPYTATTRFNTRYNNDMRDVISYLEATFNATSIESMQQNFESFNGRELFAKYSVPDATVGTTVFIQSIFHTSRISDKYYGSGIEALILGMNTGGATSSSPELPSGYTELNNKRYYS
jgi:hypothetical protein